MTSEWRTKLDQRKRRRKRREKLMRQFAVHFRRLRQAGKLTPEKIDELARKFLGGKGWQ